MKTSVAYDKLCDTLPIIKGIVDKAKADPAILEQLKAAANAKNKLDYLVVIPPILKSCKDEVFAMLAVWNDVKVCDIVEQPISTTIKQVMDIFANKDIMGFSSPVQETAQENTDTGESSITSEPTEAEFVCEEMEKSEEESTGTPANFAAYANTFPTE